MGFQHCNSCKEQYWEATHISQGRFLPNSCFACRQKVLASHDRISKRCHDGQHGKCGGKTRPKAGRYVKCVCTCHEEAVT